MIVTARVVACGVTESGKGFLLRKLFLSRCPRALILDPLGEHLDRSAREPGYKYYQANTVDEVRRQLRAAVQAGDRWRVVAPLPPKDAPQVAQLLLPNVVIGHNAFPWHVGGMALVCEELDTIAPTNPDPAIESLWRRGRHVGLTVLGATQRPHRVARIITAMSSHLVICATHEPADVEYFERVLPADAMRHVRALPWQWAVIWDNRGRRWFLLDRSQKIIEQGAAGFGATKV
jgi:hypothetical protein